MLRKSGRTGLIMTVTLSALGVLWLFSTAPRPPDAPSPPRRFRAVPPAAAGASPKPSPSSLAPQRRTCGATLDECLRMCHGSLDCCSFIGAPGCPPPDRLNLAVSKLAPGGTVGLNLHYFGDFELELIEQQSGQTLYTLSARAEGFQQSWRPGGFCAGDAREMEADLVGLVVGKQYAVALQLGKTAGGTVAVTVLFDGNCSARTPLTPCEYYLLPSLSPTQ